MRYLFLDVFPCRLVSLCVPEQKEAYCQYAVTNWDFIEKEKNNYPTFAEVIAACEYHGIKDVMELKYD
jgi:hypothetical protein